MNTSMNAIVIFWLYPKLSYETIEEMKEAVTKVIDTLKQEDFLGGSRTCRNGTSALQFDKPSSELRKDVIKCR